MHDDEQAIREVVAAWMAATKAGDARKVLSLMTEDAVFLVPGQPVMYKADFATAMAAQPSPPQFEGESQIQEIQVVGEWAFMWTKLTVRITPPGSDTTITRAGYTLSVLAKQDGRWLLARDANMLTLVRPEQADS